MRLTLKRLGEEGETMLGLLLGPPGTEIVMPTVERVWMGNEPHISCVPAGFYFLEPHDSPKHGATWALVGGTVSHFPEHVRRNLILLHQISASTGSDHLAGCIAPAMRWDSTKRGIGAVDSARAMERIRHWLRRDEQHFLTITEH